MSLAKDCIPMQIKLLQMLNLSLLIGKKIKKIVWLLDIVVETAFLQYLIKKTISAQPD